VEKLTSSVRNTGKDIDMRASRLLSILMLLQVRGKVTADELAEELEVSVRTVYRDVEALGAAGIPIYADRGPGGGFALIDGYRTRLTGLSSDEAEALFMVGLPGPAAALGLGVAAGGAAQKLRVEAGTVGEWFHLDVTDWYQSIEPTPHLPAVARAVLDRRALSMTYGSWTATRDWTVEPLGLVLKAGSWYLVGRVAGDYRTFKVSNIATLTIETATFQRPRRFDLAKVWATNLERFENGLRRETATVRATDLGLVRLAKLGAYAAAAVAASTTPDDDGWTTVDLPIEGVEHAALELLGVGPEVVVDAPRALRAKIRDLAARIAANP
jgi:predicted DNA-binding transcriptional regulator YafY